VQRTTVVSRVISLLQDTQQEQSVDLAALSEWWLDLIRPIWYERLKQRRGFRPLLLKDTLALANRRSVNGLSVLWH
jgi:hypothetical protein